ncbi:unnamed protein product [Polarella glacialis]|uniref:Prolyl 4-hydroxylase alpha subunit domain-containing protein n=1 Tax=Polarella glacialis TaxID=89957 RepID=A0A813KSI9_POLGL|nr:unnamed protein product [Polarella glacialis]
MAKPVLCSVLFGRRKPVLANPLLILIILLLGGLCNHGHRRLWALVGTIQLSQGAGRPLSTNRGSGNRRRPRCAKMLAQPAELAGDSYPCIDLEEYRQDPNFWFINKHYPGLQAVHRDPWIFVCRGLLSSSECEQLVAKAEPNMQRASVSSGDEVFLDPGRTSSDCHIPYDETPGIQQRFSELLNMPVSHMEPLKVMRYRRGEHFALHNDGATARVQGFPDCPSPWANRVITLFVYLKDSVAGGHTKFPNCGPLELKPEQGLGVIHFPSYLPSATDAAKRGAQDLRVQHSGMPAESDKFLCSQWCMTGPCIRDKAPANIRPRGKCSDTVL